MKNPTCRCWIAIFRNSNSSQQRWACVILGYRWASTRLVISSCRQCHFAGLIISSWWYTYYPSEKYARQLGVLFPIYGKIIQMFQTTNQILTQIEQYSHPSHAKCAKWLVWSIIILRMHLPVGELIGSTCRSQSQLASAEGNPCSCN